MFAYSPRDEHGQHYRSCATECVWREDEDRPPYKRPKAIVRANAKTQLDYQPTFHTERKTITGIIWRGTTRGDQDEPGSHTTKNPETTPRTWRAEGELFTYVSGDEHGRHYRSCATEWGWREDENQPPYKRPKAIVRANAKTQLDYQPTFHTERKTVAGIIWRGTTRGDQDEPGSHTTTTLRQLQGLGEQKGNCSRMPPRTSMAVMKAMLVPGGMYDQFPFCSPSPWSCVWVVVVWLPGSSWSPRVVPLHMIPAAGFISV